MVHLCSMTLTSRGFKENIIQSTVSIFLTNTNVCYWNGSLIEWIWKKVTPCTQEYGLTSLVETDQWHCREGWRLYLPKLSSHPDNRQTDTETNRRDSLLWIRSEMQKQINTIQHKKHMLGFHNTRWLFTNWTDTDSTHVMYMQAARGENKMNK